MAKRMKEDELKGLVAREISLAESDRAALASKQANALDYYQGKMSDIPPEKNRSKVVSRDLADTMGWMLPGIIRVFTASERMAVAEPVGPEDLELAKQATDGINYVFWKENDGYRTIYNATWDSLIGGNGIVKVWYDDTPIKTNSFHSGLSEDAYTELVEDDEVEVLEYTERMESGTQVVLDPTTQQPIEMPIEVPVYDVKIKRTKAYGCVKAKAIAPEDYGKDGDSQTCEEARFQYHRERKTRSDLIKMGFERDKVENLGKAADRDTPEEQARDDRGITNDGDKSTELVDLYECFYKVDIDDDGIAETIRIYYAGNKGGGDILDWEEWEDETPFNDIPCNPMPHRWEAQSIADETMDVQQIKTVLLRQALDNTYATNMPQRFVTGKLINPDELFSPNFGGAIFGEPGATVTPLEIPFVANHAYDAINYQDQVIERRTGVSRQTMALDPDALANQTATANQNSKDAAYSQIELVARNQAELGWKKVFRKIMQLEIKHQNQPKTIRMAGKFVQIDPRQWNADMDITINVGLGTGSRDRDSQMLQIVLNNQMMLTDRFAAAGFPEKSLDMVPYIMTTLDKQAEAAGIKSSELFYPEITEEDIQAAKAQMQEMQGQPTPEEKKIQAEAQAQAQLEQMKMQFAGQMEQTKGQISIQTEATKAEANAIKEQAQLEADMQTKEADRQNQIIIAQQRQAFEAQEKAKDRQLQWEIELLKLQSQEQAQERQFSHQSDSEMRNLTHTEKLKNGETRAKMNEQRVASGQEPLLDEPDVMVQGMSRMVDELAKAMVAPKRVVRGPDGRAVGIETVVN